MIATVTAALWRHPPFTNVQSVFEIGQHSVDDRSQSTSAAAVLMIVITNYYSRLNINRQLPPVDGVVDVLLLDAAAAARPLIVHLFSIIIPRCCRSQTCWKILLKHTRRISRTMMTITQQQHR